MTCSQCGKRFSARACGFAHAEIQAVTVPWFAPRGGDRPGRLRRVQTAERLQAFDPDQGGDLGQEMTRWCHENGMHFFITLKPAYWHAADIAESLALGGWTWSEGRIIP